MRRMALHSDLKLTNILHHNTHIGTSTHLSSAIHVQLRYMENQHYMYVPCHFIMCKRYTEIIIMSLSFMYEQHIINQNVILWLVQHTRFSTCTVNFAELVKCNTFFTPDKCLKFGGSWDVLSIYFFNCFKCISYHNIFRQGKTCVFVPLYQNAEFFILNSRTQTPPSE